MKRTDPLGDFTSFMKDAIVWGIFIFLIYMTFYIIGGLFS